VSGPFLFEIVEQELRVNWSDMASDDLHELKRVLHRHEEITQANNNAILVLSSKVKELEHSFATQECQIF
jgi:hypothetical protein